MCFRSIRMYNFFQSRCRPTRACRYRYKNTTGDSVRTSEPARLVVRFRVWFEQFEPARTTIIIRYRVTELRSRLSIPARATGRRALISSDLRLKFHFIIAKLAPSYAVATANRRARAWDACARLRSLLGYNQFDDEWSNVPRTDCANTRRVYLLLSRVRVQPVTLHSLFLRRAPFRRRGAATPLPSPRLSP